MEARQRLFEIRKILSKVFEEEVRNYINGKAVSSATWLGFPKSKVEFLSDRGDMIFCGYKYFLVGTGKSGIPRNPVMDCVFDYSTNFSPTFIIQGPENERSLFFLYLEHPNTDEGKSYFSKKYRKIDSPAIGYEVYHLEDVEMLESKEFKKCITEMAEDLAPDKLDDIKKLLA